MRKLHRTFALFVTFQGIGKGSMGIGQGVQASVLGVSGGIHQRFALVFKGRHLVSPVLFGLGYFLLYEKQYVKQAVTRRLWQL